jgi:hypothetical protein
MTNTQRNEPAPKTGPDEKYNAAANSQKEINNATMIIL